MRRNSEPPGPARGRGPGAPPIPSVAGARKWAAAGGPGGRVDPGKLAADAEGPGAAPGLEISTVLGQDPGEVRASLRALPDGLPLRLFAAMARLRAFDERAVILQRQGEIGTYPPYYGEEAVQAGSVLALEGDDWLFPTYRQASLATLRGCPPEVPLLMWRGNPSGWYDVQRYRTAPVCVPVASNYPHAVGAAWGSRLQGRPTVALVYGGDGSTSEGEFHEACNLAAVVAAPVVFLVTNNQWAISTPLRLQTKVTRIAEKAAAYGMPGVRVDGFDVFACHAAVAQAAARGRAGLGPTLVEAVGYRLGPHGTADDPSVYRDPAEAEGWMEMEPLGRAASALVAAGLAGVEELDRIRTEAAAEMMAAADRLPTFPVPGIEEVADTVHLNTPWTLTPAHLREPTHRGGG